MYFYEIWYPVVACLVLIIGIIYAIVTHIFYKITKRDNLLLKNEVENLSSSNLDHIREIERLQERIKNLCDTITELRNIRESTIDATKSHMFELGNNIADNLLKLHKRESEEQRKINENNFNTVVNNITTEFDKIVHNVIKLNEEMSQSRTSIENIKNAFISPIHAGQFGEITLDNILTQSGLRKGTDFILQPSINISNEHRLRPDAFIFLPSNALIIVDAKWSKFIIDSDPKSFVRTIYAHIKNLYSKDYQNCADEYYKKKFNNKIVVMFLPTDTSVDKIHLADSQCINYAATKDIYIVGPSGMMGMISIARSKIQDDAKEKSYDAIMTEVTKLIQSITNLAEYANKLGSNIQTLTNSYDKFAGSFNRTFLSKVKNIIAYGAQSISTPDSIQTIDRYQIIASRDIIEHE